MAEKIPGLAKVLAQLEPGTNKVAIAEINKQISAIGDEIGTSQSISRIEELRSEASSLGAQRRELEGLPPTKEPGAYGKTIEERVEAAAKRHKWRVKRTPGEYARLDFDDHFNESKLRGDGARYLTTTPQGRHTVVDTFREANYSASARKRILPDRQGMRVKPMHIKGGPYKSSYEIPQQTGDAALLKKIRGLQGSVLPEGGAHLVGRGATLRQYAGRDQAKRTREEFKFRRAQRRADASEMFKEQMQPRRPKQAHGPKTKGPYRVNIEDIAAKQKDWWPGHETNPIRKRSTVVKGYHGTGFDLKKIKPVFHFGTRKSAMDRMVDQSPGVASKRLLEVQVRSNRMSGTPIRPLSEGILERQDMMYMKPHKLKQMPRQLKKADLAYYLNDVEDAGSTTAVAMKPSRVKIKNVIQVGDELPTRAGMKMLSEAEKQAKMAPVHPTRQRTERIRAGQHPSRDMGKHEDTAAKAITKYKKKLGFENKSLTEVNIMEEKLTIEQEAAATKTWGKKEHKPLGSVLDELEKAEVKVEQKRLSTEIRKNTPIREPSPKILKQQAPEVGRLANPTSVARQEAAHAVVRKGIAPKVRVGGMVAGLISGIPAALGEAGEHRMRQEALKKQGLEAEPYSKKDFLRFMRDRIGVPQPTHPRDLGI